MHCAAAVSEHQRVSILSSVTQVIFQPFLLSTSYCIFCLLLIHKQDKRSTCWLTTSENNSLNPGISPFKVNWPHSGYWPWSARVPEEVYQPLPENSYLKVHVPRRKWSHVWPRICLKVMSIYIAEMHSWTTQQGMILETRVIGIPFQQLVIFRAGRWKLNKVNIIAWKSV